MVHSKEYNSWRAMKRRCLNKNAANFKRYGGSNITICPAWLSFENFFSDMGVRPDGTTLDRIDNTLGYFKENCRWATIKQQNQNLKSNVYITHNNERLCACEWSQRLGGSDALVSARLSRGWTIEKAVTTPVKRY